MKFLCVECDRPMKLESTSGPDRGAMTVVFACPSCGKQTAMLTNPMETQMVSTLGVKIGGRTVPAEPMEMLTGSLEEGVEPDAAGHAAPEAAPAENASKCPFTGMVNEAMAGETSAVRWSEEAEARISRIPSFARAMVRKSIEQHAREKGYAVIDAGVMEEVRGMFGM